MTEIEQELKGAEVSAETASWWVSDTLLRLDVLATKIHELRGVLRRG